MVRIQKIIAQSGVASRRKAEELIRSGQVTVNGRQITQMGEKVDPEKDVIKVNGKKLGVLPRLVYFLLNKPPGYICTVHDPEGRHTVLELVPSVRGIYPVGRLDYNSEGLLLLTNDGSLAYRLSRAGSHAPKTYEVKVQGIPSRDNLHRLTSGLRLGDGTSYGPMRIAPLKKSDQSIHRWFRVVLTEGKNREIRKAFEEIGHRILRLKRTSLAFLNLAGVPVGSFRSLLPQEVEKLKGIRPTGPGDRGEPRQEQRPKKKIQADEAEADRH